MKNYNYLSPKEQLIFSQISDYKDIFTSEDIKNLTGKKQHSLLMSLKKKDYIISLKRGHYATKEAFLENPYLIASELEKGAIAFISALKLHGLISYEPSSIFIITDRKSYKVTALNYIIYYVNLKRKSGITSINGIFATSIEKTIVDSIFKPEFSGGYPIIAKAIFDAKINWESLIKCLEGYGKSSLYQKLGYILSILKKAGKRIPDYVLKELKGHIKNKIRLIPNPKLAYRYIKEWKIMDNLGESHILGDINGA